MIESLSMKLATRIKQENPDHPASLEVLKFSIAAVLNVFGTIILSVTVAILLDHLWATVIAMVAFAALRGVSGGYHLNSSVGCLLITSAIANILPYIQLSDTIVVVFTVISMILALLFATNNIENQTRIPKKYFPLLRAVSVILIATNFIFQSDVVALAFLLQALSLIRIGGERE